MVKGKRPMGRSRTRWYSQVLEDMKTGKRLQEMTRRTLHEDRRDWRFIFH
jgi:hypothetical protein